MMKVDFAGKVALGTGSGKGIGKAIELRLAQNGADIVVKARSEDTAMQVVKQANSLGTRASFEQADKWNYQQLRQMVDNVIREFGKIDILVAERWRGPLPEGRRRNSFS